MIEQSLAEGSRSRAPERYFEAHEAFEDAWRAAQPDERDFFQGLVHVVVAWYQDGRGNETGCRRQLEKAARRLAAYAPRIEASTSPRSSPRWAALGRARCSPLTSPRPSASSTGAQADVQPPLAVEEEQQPERDEHDTADDP